MWKLWTRERLTAAQLQSHLQDQVVVQAASAAAYDVMVPPSAQRDGMVRYLVDLKRVEARVAGGWQPLGYAPSVARVGAWTEAAGQFGNATQLITSLALPDIGRPYRISAVAAGEIGSVSAGTRWDMQLRTTGGGVADQTLDTTIATAETTVFQRITTGIGGTVYTGAATLSIYAVRAYGSALGNVTALNRRFSAIQWPTP